MSGTTCDGTMSSIDWMRLLEEVAADRPHASPAEVRALAPQLRDWTDKRILKNMVLARHRVAARRAEDQAGGT